MIHRRLRDELERVAGRYRSLKLWQGLAVAWLAVAVFGGVLWMLGPVLPVSVRAAAPVLLGLGFVLQTAFAIALPVAPWLAAIAGWALLTLIRSVRRHSRAAAA